MSLQLLGTHWTETAQSTPGVNITLSISPPTRPASADPAHDAESAIGDINIQARSKTLFPAIRARLEQHSPKLKRMIRELPPGGALDVPEDDWVVEELRRWTDCAGLPLPTELEAQPVLSPNERLATLLRVAHTHDVSAAMATLYMQLDEDFRCAYPIAVRILDALYGLATEMQFDAGSLPPEDPVDLKLSKALFGDQADLLLQLATKSERPSNEAAMKDPSYS